MARPDIDRRGSALSLFFVGSAEQHGAGGHDDDRADHGAGTCQAASTGHDRHPAPEHRRRHGQSHDWCISDSVHPSRVRVVGQQRREVSSFHELSDDVVPAIGSTTLGVGPQDVRGDDLCYGRESTLRRPPVRVAGPRAWLGQPDHYWTTHRLVYCQPLLTRLVSSQQTADVVSPREQVVAAHSCLRL
jgi:hypothetical protein